LPVASELNSHGPFFHALAALDFETLGCAIVALFVVGWAPSVLIWKYRRMEERWGS
jgi:high-affinity nickel-transport protein